MSEHSPKAILIDILDAVEAVLEFTDGMGYDDFVTDRKTRDAVYRNFEVMGEAVNRLSESFLNNHRHIPWRKMKATRNAFIHGYDKIDNKIVWRIVDDILPNLKNDLSTLLHNI